MNKNNVKKGFLFVLCMVLVSVVSIVGTMAVLTKKSNSVVNTFVATQSLTAGLTLTETGATGSEGTLNKTFSGIVPGHTVTDKDPTFTVNKVNAQAYLFVEIVETGNKLKNSSDPFYSYNIASGWTLLESTAGKQGGKVWYRTLEISDATNATYQVLLDNTVTFADYTEGNAPDNATMSIYGYMVQTSGYNDAKTAFTNTTWN